MPIGGTELAFLVDDRLPGGVTERVRDKYLTFEDFGVIRFFLRRVFSARKLFAVLTGFSV